MSRSRGFVIRTDGASRANPGHASAGAVLIDLDRPDAFDPGAVPDASISDYLGIQTNNVAEYTAVVRALALAAELGAREVRLLLDSMLIVEQLHGRWRVKDAKLKPLNAEALRILRTFDRWTAAHVRAPRTSPPTRCATRRSTGPWPADRPRSSSGRRARSITLPARRPDGRASRSTSVGTRLEESPSSSAQGSG